MAKVVASGNPKFETGDLVVGAITWGEYSVLKDGNMVEKLDPMGLPLTYYVGILGTTLAGACSCKTENYLVQKYQIWTRISLTSN